MTRLLHRRSSGLCYDRFVTRMRRYLLIFLAFCCLSTVSSGQPGPPAPPKLILVVSVDQMRFDFLERFAPLYRSGLRTLLERGAVFSNAKYRHAATETGPGHSVLMTGSDPETLWHRRERVVGPVSQARRQRGRRPCTVADRRVRPGRLAGKPADVYGRRRAEKQESRARMSSASAPRIVRPFSWRGIVPMRPIGSRTLVATSSPAATT